MNERFEGKVAFVTGGASGLGAAAAKRFSDEGAQVAVADIDAAGAEKVAASLRDGYAVQLDTSDAESVARGVADVVEHFGRLDVVFNNAGVGTMVVGGTVETIPLEKWDLALDVNVRAIYLVSRAAVVHLRAAGGGSIVNTASVSAFRGSRGRPSHAYAASKGAVLSLTRAMASSYGADRIRVNAICPGTIRTRLTADIIEGAERDAAAGRIPLGRVGEPEDIARCALFLASSDASWITGIEIVVDGGVAASTA
jgi:meso-butanediol dehydrogenase / (S,S)-butanediol dehydrogenase / diacetyl reductase